MTVHNAKVNLTGSSARATLATNLERACGKTEELRPRVAADAWLGILNRFFEEVDRDRETGEPIRQGGAAPRSEA